MNVLGVPLTDLCATRYTDPRERQLLKNIVYVGVLAALLGVEPEVIATLLGEQYKGKAKLIQPNLDAFMMGLHHGREYFDDATGPAHRASRRGGQAHLHRRQRRRGAGLRVRRRDGVRLVPDHAVVVGRRGVPEVLRQAARRQSQRPEQVRDRAGRRRDSPRSASSIGAGWNGARAFTATSGPGVSLMTEFIGLAYFAEMPVTIINVQRGGPSTGMPTRTQQADVLSCAYASHGDTKHVLLFPEDPNECFEFAAQSLDLADRLQTPIFLMTDLDIGMNHRLCEPLKWDDSRSYDRGKVMTREDLDAGRDFGRYLDVDGDGIPYRTLPGTHPDRGAYFTRGTTRDAYARYSEAGPDYLYNVERLLRKFETAKALVPQPMLRDAARATRFGVHLLRLDQPGDGRGLRLAAGAGRARRPAAGARIPVQRRGGSVHRRARAPVRRRAEPRCPAAHAAGDRAGSRTRPSSSRCCTTTARRSRRASSPRQIADAHQALQRRADQQRQGRLMTYLAKPKLHHPTLPANALGFTRRDYEGKISTLCAGCGHDSISAALVQACWELAIEPHRVAKLSGIGCSSKTPDYFLGNSHGFNTVHGRMPSVLTGANLANRDLLYLGVSGDGDSASIGLGQFAHAMRRGVNMTYIVENNGVYGLTKGQFSATADAGSKSKRGAINTDTAIDLVALALQLGASYVGAQLLRRQGAAGAADQGRDAPRRRGADRRHQPLRGLQQPRRQHQELRLCARSTTKR